MNEEDLRELRELKEMLLDLDRKIDKMIDKIDRVIEKAGGIVEERETKSGWRVVQVDGDPQVISWEHQSFDIS